MIFIWYRTLKWKSRNQSSKNEIHSCGVVYLKYWSGKAGHGIVLKRILQSIQNGGNH